MKSSRAFSVALIIAAFAVLAIAYFVQYGLRMAPCELCLLERWPYRLTAVLAVIAFAFPAIARWFIALAGLVMLAGAALAFFHIGVEAGWWPSPFPSCNSVLIPGMALPPVPAIPCDRPVYLIPRLPVSMAMMDFLATLAFVFAITAHVIPQIRRSR